MAIPAIIGAATGVVGLVSGLFKKKRYVLWIWTGTEWQAVAEGTSKTVKNAKKDYDKQGFTTVYKKAGVTPPPLQTAKSDSTFNPIWIVAGAVAVAIYWFFGRKRR